MIRIKSQGFFRIYVFLLSIALGLIFTSCEQVKTTVDEKLVETFVDIRVMEQTLGADSPEARIARRDILKKNGYTLESFKISIDNVLADKDLWLPFQKAVVAQIDTLLNQSSSVTERGGKK